MFGPDANNDPLTRPPNPIQSASQLRQNPPEISHKATRLADDDDLDAGAGLGTGTGTGGGNGGSRRGSTRVGSPTRSRVAAAIGGTPCMSTSFHSSTERQRARADANGCNVSVSADHPTNTMPTFNNHALVPALPSPSPEQLGPQAVAQLMTWGSIMSTPRALDETSTDPLDAVPNVFKIQEPKKRDQIGRRLATDAARAMRERARGYGGGGASRGLAVLSHSGSRTGSRGLGLMGPPPTPGSSVGGLTPARRQADDLTPAGRSLLERSMGTPGSKSRGAGGTGLLGGSASSRSRSDAMDRAGGWSNLGSEGRRKEASTRTW